VASLADALQVLDGVVIASLDVVDLDAERIRAHVADRLCCEDRTAQAFPVAR
jgi:hypothetical protein